MKCEKNPFYEDFNMKGKGEKKTLKHGKFWILEFGQPPPLLGAGESKDGEVGIFLRQHETKEINIYLIARTTIRTGIRAGYKEDNSMTTKGDINSFN